MDDNARTLTIDIKGHLYDAAPLDEGQMVAIQLIRSLPETSILPVLGSLLRAALGDDGYTGLIVRMSASEVSLQDLMAGLTNLAKATGDAKTEAKKATKKRIPGDRGTLDIAGELPGDGN